MLHFSRRGLPGPRQGEPGGSGVRYTQNKIEKTLPARSFSNRHPCRLESHLSPCAPATSLFLIVTRRGVFFARIPGSAAPARHEAARNIQTERRRRLFGEGFISRYVLYGTYIAAPEAHSRGQREGFGIPVLKDHVMRHISRSLFFLAPGIAAAIVIAMAAPGAIMAAPMPQGGSAQIVLAQVHVAPAMTMQRTTSMPFSMPLSIPLLAASFRSYEDAAKSPAPLIQVFAGPYEPGQSMAQLLPTEEFRTVFFTQSSVPLAQAWSGRMQLGAFESTLRVQNLQLFPGGPRAIHSSGISLSFHFGRDARTGHPAQAWRCHLSRIFGSVLN